MMKYILLFLALVPLSIDAQQCACDSIFLQTSRMVEENYAGWFDKIKGDQLVELAALTTKISGEVQWVESDSACAKKLQEWVGFFHDKHLRIRYTKPKQSIDPTIAGEAKELQIFRTDLNESSIEAYLKSATNLDPIEGFYLHPSYKLGITRVGPNLFHAGVITTQNNNWKPGDVKLVIRKIGDRYEGTFYEGDKSDFSDHQVQLVDNILDFDIVFFEKVFPEVAIKRDITEYEMSKDKFAPSLRFEGNTAIWAFPSFYNNAEEQTSYLLEKYKSQLGQTPNWILDVRGNDGGDYRIGLQLMDYIYDGPFLLFKGEMRMTEANYNLWYTSFVEDYYESADSSTKALLDVDFNKMKANFGKMYNESGKVADTITMDNVSAYPSKIVLLMDENTASSGELFTMVARQSKKVTVMGQNSYGMMDYGNVVQYKTACPSIRLMLPIDRMLWLDTGFSVDKEGLKPDIYQKGEDLEAQAKQFLSRP